MGQIKLWWRNLPISIAFVVCSLTFVALALFLTHLTVEFASRNMEEIQLNYLVMELPTEMTDDMAPRSWLAFACMAASTICTVPSNPYPSSEICPFQGKSAPSSSNTCASAWPPPP